MTSHHKRQIIALTAVICAAATIGIVAVRSLEKNLVYYLSPQQLLERGDAAKDATVRLGGVVCARSLDWNAQTTRLLFKVGMSATCEGATIAVLCTSAPPQMFREGIGVVLEGRYDGALFNTERLMVKHSNEYHPPKEGASPHDIITDGRKDESTKAQ